MIYSTDRQIRSDYALQLPESDLSDEYLMERIKKGDEMALELLDKRYHSQLCAIIRGIISNEHDVDEVIQECLVELWKRATSYDPEKGRAFGWLVTLTRRRTIDLLRRRYAYSRKQERFRVTCETEAQMRSGEMRDKAADDDTARIIARLIADLPEAQGKVVRLCFFSGMSHRQIAAHTGIPLGTIKTRLDLAMRKLRSAVLAIGELHEQIRPVARL